MSLEIKSLPEDLINKISAGENLDRAMKYFDDFKSQQRKIQKLMHSAEMDSDGNLVITPRSTQGAKKIRSMMQDVLAPRKKETNENYDAKQPKVVRIRGLTGQRVTQVMKNMTPAQKQRLMKKLGPKVRKLTKGGAFVADRIMQQNESFKRGGYTARLLKQKLREKRAKNVAAFTEQASGTGQDGKTAALNAMKNAATIVAEGIVDQLNAKGIN